MGYNDYSTQTLLDNIALTGHVPNANSTFTPQNIVTLADRELKTPIIKQILSARGNYYLTSQTYASTTSGLYDIPPECIAGALYNVELVQNTTIIQVQPIEIPEQFSTNAPTSNTYGYYLVSNRVQILPTPPVGNVRLWYYRRPSQLILPTDACLVSGVDVTGTIVTVTSIHSQISIGKVVDLIGDQPPFNVNGSAIITDITGMVITLDSTPTTLLVPGNYIALYQQTPIPQIPVEFRILLEQRTICSIYEIQKMDKPLKMARDKLMEIEKDTLQLITNRVDSKVAIINPVGGFFSSRSARLGNFPASRVQ